MRSKKDTDQSFLSISAQPTATSGHLLHLKHKLSLAKKIEKNLIKRLLHAILREELLPYHLKNNALYIPLNRSCTGCHQGPVPVQRRPGFQ